MPTERADSNVVSSGTDEDHGGHVDPPVPGEPLDPEKLKWKNTLQKPPVYAYTLGRDAEGSLQDYRVTVRTKDVQMLPEGYPKTKVLAYAGTVVAEDGRTEPFEGSPGATFEMTRGTRARVTWINEVTESHVLQVNAPPHDIPEAQTKVPYVTHLHGLEVPSLYDGFPKAWFTANDGPRGADYATNVYVYPNSQPATALWYHDHTFGMTSLNVYAGLAGMYIIRDARTEPRPAWLPDEAHEMPLVIQDRYFNSDGSLSYSGGTGDTNVVNGRVWPKMEVERTRYRFRVLNGANSRFYNLYLSDEKATMTVIGSDGGYLAKPANVESVLLSPGERADVLIDFSEVVPGTSVTLKNDAAEFYPGDGDPNLPVGDVVRFDVPSTAGKLPAAPALPPALATIPVLTPNAPKRTLTLNFADNGAYVLDGQMWNGTLSEKPQVGATEEWDIVNLTSLSHPIHLHLVQFRVIGRQEIEKSDYESAWLAENGNTSLPFQSPTKPLAVDGFSKAGSSFVPAGPAEDGWKDTVIVNPESFTRIHVRWAPQDAPATVAPGTNAFTFDPTTGPGYVWHCHMLEHEDMEMMRPFVVRNERSTP